MLASFAAFLMHPLLWMQAMAGNPFDSIFFMGWSYIPSCLWFHWHVCLLEMLATFMEETSIIGFLYYKCNISNSSFCKLKLAQIYRD